MDEAAVKAARQLLRQVQEHLDLAHDDLGVRRQTVGLVEVVHHPDHSIADLNHVTPRRHTAWVAAQFIQAGLDRLAALQRTPCVQYIEGLFPPLFAKTLRELGLDVERETPLMLYNAAGHATAEAGSNLDKFSSQDQIDIETISDQRGSDRWWELWRNGLYDVLTPGIEPLVRWRERGERHGQLKDVLLYREKSLAGVARLSLQVENGTAHIVALALLQEVRSPELTRALILAALRHALEQGCKIAFAPGETEDVRRLCREIGFMDVGSVICYIQRKKPDERSSDGAVVQPVLAGQ